MANKHQVENMSGCHWLAAVALLAGTVFLASCGGGGGGGSTPTPTPTPTPTTVTITCPDGASKTAATLDQANALCPAPQLVSVTPANGVTTVSPDTFTGVTAITDSLLDPTTLTATFKAGNNALMGNSSLLADKKGIKFDLVLPTKLSYSQPYTFSATVKDTLGRTLTVTSTFTTTHTACTAPAVWDGSACTVPPPVCVAPAVLDGMKCVVPLAITEYSQGLTTPLPYAGIAYIAPGPDGNMWFTEQDGNRIGRITPAGVITEFSAGMSAGARPRRLAAGPDGAMWFTEEGLQRIGRITMNGVITEFSAGISSDAGILFDIAKGADGNMWFTEAGGQRVGRITPTGVVTEFQAGTTANGWVSGITAGPDGNMWYAHQGTPASAIGRITPAGAVKEFSVGLTGQTNPIYITKGSDGNLWFTERYSSRIGRITMAGVITEFALPADSNPWDITLASDGNVYFSSDGGSPGSMPSGRITTAGAVTAVPFVGRGVAAGPDGNLWGVGDLNAWGGVEPSVRRSTLTGTTTDFNTGITPGVRGGSPDSIVAGPDGNLWFVEMFWGSHNVGRITLNGKITEFNPGWKPDEYFNPSKIVSGSDGALWVSTVCGVGRLTPEGVFSALCSEPWPRSPEVGIVSGPDGAIWFIEPDNNRIGRVTTGGVSTFFSNGISSNAGFSDMAVGPDDNLWFTECSLDRIGRITPSGVVTEFSAGITAKSCPRNIIAGPDGNLWFTERSNSYYLTNTPPPYTPGGIPNRNAIGRITPIGVVTEFGEEALYSSGLTAITVGPDGNLWFTEDSGNRVGRITPAGVITEFKLNGLADYAGLSSITKGPDGKLWFTEKNANKIGNFTPP